MKKELPKNWIQTKLDQVVTSKKGKKPKKLMEMEFENSVPYLDIKAFEKNEIRRYADIQSSNIIHENQVGIVWDGARSGWVTKGKYGAVGSTIAILSPKGVNENYLLKFLESKFEYLNTNTRGTGIPHVDPKILWDIDFPLAPLLEQDRIVSKLDKFYKQLEIIKTSLEKIPVLLKNFRQQVLTQAVTGKLTEEWRKTKAVKIVSPIVIGEIIKEKPEGWKWRNLIEISKLESGHTPRKSKLEYWENGDVPWISLQDIRAAHGNVISETKYKPNRLGIKNSSARLLPKGTVCFSRDISVGYTTIMGKEMSTTQHFANWICSQELNNEYLLFAFMAAKNHLTSSGQGTTVKTIYMPALKKFRLLTPPIEEQKLIVNQTKKLLKTADTIEEIYLKIKEKVDNLPQAILYKAFNGELVPQLESDGDARELLEEMEKLTKEIGTKTQKVKRQNKKYGKGDVELKMSAEGMEKYEK